MAALAALIRGVGAAALALVLVGCTATDACERPAADDGDCPDLTFSGELYDEWRPGELPAVTQELGDGRYPACNDAEACNGPDLDGYGATDVWLLEGVDPRQALIGYRQGSETPVIFLRRGVDPDAIGELPAD